MNVTKSSKLKTSAHTLIQQEIERHGVMPFYEFVNLALYHPQYGYYQQKKSQRGREGDYFTSMQVGPLFPQILAETFLAMRDYLNTNRFHIIEIGSGNGELLEEVLKVLDKKKKLKGFSCTSIEKSRFARDRIWRRLSRFANCQVLPSLEEVEWIGGVDGCIFSNEFFDAIPFHRFRKTKEGWKEICVAHGLDGFFETEQEASDPSLLKMMESRSLDIQENQEIEVRPNGMETWQQWSQVLNRGFVLTFDYGYPRPQLVEPRRKRGTWQCFYKHKANENPFEKIGNQDITAHVDFTSLVQNGAEVGFEPRLFCSQGIFLSFLGQQVIQEFLSQAKDPTEQRKRAGVVQQLVHPDTMGEAFWALLQSKNTDMPPSFRTIPNRIKRLLV